MSHKSIIDDMEVRQGELQEAIKNAARTGGDTLALRNELKTLQQKLQAARNDVATMQAAGRNDAARATGKIGEELTGTAIANILAGTTPFADILADGVPAIDFTGAPALQNAMHNLAEARARVTYAEADHASATAEADDLAGKVSSNRARHAEILRQRTTGDAGEFSSAELYAIGEDLRTLEGMHVEAQEKADTLLPTVNEARIALKAAEKQAAIIEHRLAAEHLVAHAKALEVAYIACLRAAQSEGSKVGIGIGALFKASLDLRTFVSSGNIPAPFRHA